MAAEHLIVYPANTDSTLITCFVATSPITAIPSLSPIMPLTIDHTAIVVPAAKLDDVIKFLLAALKPLGLKEMMRPIPTSVGLGDQTPFFWVTGIEGDAKTLELVMQNEHTAFSAHGR
jgi:hypothetical protein